MAKIHYPVLFIRGETKLGGVMADEEIAWLKRDCSNVECAHISGVGPLLHLQEQGQMPVLAQMTKVLDRIPVR